MSSNLKYKEQLSFFDCAVKPDLSTFETLDEAITCICSIARQCLRINREYGTAHEVTNIISMWKGHHMVTMQRLWNVLAYLDLVF